MWLKENKLISQGTKITGMFADPYILNNKWCFFLRQVQVFFFFLENPFLKKQGKYTKLGFWNDYADAMVIKHHITTIPWKENLWPVDMWHWICSPWGWGWHAMIRPPRIMHTDHNNIIENCSESVRWSDKMHCTWLVHLVTAMRLHNSELFNI